MPFSGALKEYPMVLLHWPQPPFPLPPRPLPPLSMLLRVGGYVGESGGEFMDSPINETGGINIDNRGGGGARGGGSMGESTLIETAPPPLETRFRARCGAFLHFAGSGPVVDLLAAVS